MREDLVFEIAEGIEACATLQGGWQDTLFLFLHCYKGNVRFDALPDHAGRFFAKNGISFLGVNLYDPWNEKARNLSDKGLTIESHVPDIWKIMEIVRNRGVRNIHIGGHSASAYIAVMSAHAPPEVAPPASIICWDGSEPAGVGLEEEKYYDPETDRYIVPDGPGSIVAGSYVRSVKGMNLKRFAKGWSTPTLAIEAGNNKTLMGASKRYRECLGASVTTFTVPGCKHHFIDNDKGLRRLFEKTLAWITHEHLNNSAV